MPGNSERTSFLSGAGKAAKGETEEKGNDKDKKDEAPPEVRRPCSSLFQISRGRRRSFPHLSSASGSAARIRLCRDDRSKKFFVASRLSFTERISLERSVRSLVKKVDKLVLDRIEASFYNLKCFTRLAGL